MGAGNPPRIDVDYDGLPAGDRERRRMLLDLFGLYLCWVRERAARGTRDAIASEEARRRLPPSRRRKYERIAEATEEQQGAAAAIAEASIDRFAEKLLSLLGDSGLDLRLGEDHAVNFRLDAEIVDLRSMAIVEEATLTRDSDRHPADLFRQWLADFTASTEVPRRPAALVGRRG